MSVIQMSSCKCCNLAICLATNRKILFVSVIAQLAFLVPSVETFQLISNWNKT